MGWSSSVYGLVVVGLTSFLLLALGILVLAPKQFDPYTTDQYDPERTGYDTKKISYGQDAQSKKQEAVPFTSSVQIVVLGDIGRSPRMQYHAISLADRGAYVNIVGYLESEIHPALRQHPNVKVTSLPGYPNVLQTNNKLWFPLLGPLKVLFQACLLFYVLGYSRPTKWMLIQNPPSIPVLAIARFTSYMRNTRLVIDWHNFGWSVLALKLGSEHPLVKISRLYEKGLARTADRHFAVTQAMADWMGREMAVKALTLYDRPTEDFRPLPSGRRLHTLSRLVVTEPYAEAISTGKILLVVSSTSWTPDEDFGLLLEALKAYAYSTQVAPSANLPQLLVVITGKGPQKEHYLRKIVEAKALKDLSNVEITTAWLEFTDYALLLSAADLGVSLHKSSSGLDLPMKVVDMFGAGLPVIGWSDYESWPELVQEGVNGRGFKDSEELAKLLVELFSQPATLATLKEGAMIESRRRWNDEWNAVAGDRVFFPERAKKK